MLQDTRLTLIELDCVQGELDLAKTIRKDCFTHEPNDQVERASTIELL